MLKSSYLTDDKKYATLSYKVLQVRRERKV